MFMKLIHQSIKREENAIRDGKDVHRCVPPPYLEEEEEKELQDLLVFQTFNNIILSFSEIFLK
jgi:hypothetical protein